MELDRDVVVGTVLVPELLYAELDPARLEAPLLYALLLLDFGRVYVDRLFIELLLLFETFTGGRA